MIVSFVWTVIDEGRMTGTGVIFANGQASNPLRQTATLTP